MGSKESNQTNKRTKNESEWNIKVIFVLLLAYGIFSFHLFFRAVIGEIDDDTDGSLDFPNIKAEPLNSVVHW